MMEKDAATTLRARHERRDEQAEYPSTHDTATPPSLRGHAASRRRDEAMAGRMPSPSGPRTNGLYIDVNAPAQPVSPVALASPLAIFSTKKLPANAYRSHPVAELASDRRLLTKLNGSPFLEYGMVVSIVCDDRDGILSAEGFASREARLEMINYEVSTLGAKLGLGGREERNMFEERGVRLIDGSFRDCLFEVVPRMTYDATIALNEVLSDNASGKQTPSHSGIAVSSVADLKFKSDAEMRLNAMTYRKLKGTQVMYGHTIQLRHVKSRQFLSLDTMPLSFRGAEYAKVSLDTDSPRCNFVILPRFKLRAMGAPVQLTDQVILTGGDDLQPFNLYDGRR
ncbi:hypothetical protein Poli38472_000340 [Pythium oligandrum]|uniref:Inositol 1,4,5-trisphosphate/ryanodine receptor domain-containing protein n=1 Tax=Pythium oligandrum TaxID=41045 RepID=A0A8K1FJ16_PYTOL|nr:hypothetical protein Poli38472_000340 [Pythium oligandrum]|eukprot:TMW60298.1 hypothetical protein Poli38472_000340 [Pythium oligandrum]